MGLPLRIAFLHHALKGYRSELFRKLTTQLNLHFFFTREVKNTDSDINFEEFSGRYEVLKEYKTPVFASGFAPSVIPKLLRYNPDIVIASTLTSFSTYVSFLLAKILGRKFVIFSEDWHWFGGILGRLTLFVSKIILRHTDAVVAAGTKSAEFLMSLGASNIHVGINSASDLSRIDIDPDKLDEMKSKFEGRRIILYLSRIMQYKGLDILLRAHSIIENSNPDAFLVVGGDGPFRMKCEEIAKDLHLENYAFLGRIEENELVYYFHLCDVFVLPSRFMAGSRVTCEAWGMVINEAMSLGKPIVSTTAVAAAYDLILNGVNGFRVRENDYKDMARAIDLVLRRPEFGQESLKIIPKASPSQQTEAFIQAIRSVAKNQ